MNYSIIIADLLDANTELRRERGAEFPEDRNNAAADSSANLATKFRNDGADGDIMTEYAEMFTNDNPSVEPYIAEAAVSVIVNTIGFGRDFADPEDFLVAVIRQAKGPVAP